MSIQQKYKPELHDLLAQLARFFSANETRISAEQVSKCLGRLSAFESSALNRLFFLLYQSKTPESESSGKRGCISRPGGTRNHHSGTTIINNPRRIGDVPSVVRTVSLQDGLSASLSGDRPSHTGHAQEHQPSLASVSRNDDDQPNQPRLHGGTWSNHMAAVISHIDSQSTPCSGFTDNTTLFQQPISNIAPVLVDSHQAEATAPHNGTDDDTFGKTGLATCSEIKFAPSTKRLLEACKTNCGEFLRAISEAKAAFPTGQGWEAAIATKKENADIRDLMRIYHRFECYNIYRHVVEAGYHTGTHWIREMRAVLANKLCRDFPARFQNQKTANKCLNWVDQGCSYHEWTEILSETPNLGYLIALPSDVSHSAYTSRCTKEKMNTAVLKFKSLGIDDVVKNLKLAELGNNIAAKLREMTGKKRKDVNGERTIQNSRKSPRLTSSSSILALALQSGQKTTAPESMAAANQHLFDHPTESLMSTSTQEHVGNHGRQDQNTSGSVADDYVVPYDPFNNLGLNSPAYSELFMNQYSAISIPFDEWYQHPNYAEGCATN